MATLTISHLKQIPPPPSWRTSTRVPDTITLLKICRNKEDIRQIHAQLVVSGLLYQSPNAVRLLESYVAISQTQDALLLFDGITWPDAFGYNVMIRGLTMCNQPYNSLVLYKKLLQDGLLPDNHTYTFVLKACSKTKALSEGKQVHGQIIKAGKKPDTYIHSSLIHMYTSSGSMDCAECVLREFQEDNTSAKNTMISGYMNIGNVEKARSMFDDMKAKDVASWSALITGYTKNSMYIEALATFHQMVLQQIPVNESVLVSSLSACSHLGSLDQGKRIHAYIDQMEMAVSTRIGTALIDMYSKCGKIKCAYSVFQKMPQRDIVAWGAIISGFSIHGRAAKCFELFDEMVSDGTCPNEVIFVAMLSACSHAGYVELGYHYFKKMVQDYGIRPSIEHYGCMIDLLSRSNRLAEAEQLINSMPEKPNSVIWGTLLSACRNYNDPTRGIWAFRNLAELEPQSGDRYKLAALLLASAGEQKVAASIRNLIKQKEMKTTCGSSFIEIEGLMHEFRSGKIDPNKAKEICKVWEGLDG